VLGRRVPTAHGAWPLHARLANRVLARELRRRTGAPLTDLGPMRAARREAMLGLAVRDRRCGYPLETVLRAADAGWRIAEVPVAYRHRVGRSKITGTVRGTVTAVADMRRVLAEGAA
jgi:dTDP-L-rhamnose 4-epimerase